MIAPGSTVDGYLLEKQLGEGPFGLVFQAKDLRRNTAAAVKLLRPSLATPPQSAQTFGRLQASIKAYAELVHPNLAQVHRTLQDPSAGAFGVALELVEGQTLDRVQVSLLSPARQVDPARLARLVAWFEQLARTLAWLHARKVVHGNLKPTNVVLLPGAEPTLKLLDLCWSAIGVARPSPGVVNFLSPEQLDGVPPTAASDQWTLADMLHRMLSAGAKDVALSPAYGVPAPLLQALDRARRRDPSARFGDVGELAEALRAVRASLPSASASKSGDVSERRSAPPKTAPSKGSTPPRPAAPAPVPGGAIDEPATVRVPLDGPRMSRVPSLPVEDDHKLESRDLVLDVKGEPSLALDSLTLPPEAHLAPGGRSPPSRRISPLALWGTVLLVIAVVVVLGTARWFKAKTSIAAEVPTTAALPTGQEQRSKPEGEPVRTADAKPEATEGDKREASAAKTVAREVPIREEAAKTAPKTTRAAGSTAAGSTAGASGAVGGASRALDAKADAAMAKLAALGSDTKPADGAPSDAKAGEADPKRAAEVSCNRGDPVACLQLGNYLRADSTPKGDEGARRAYDRACALESPEACHRAAVMWKDGRGGSADAARAKALEASACKLGRTWSCRSDTKTSSAS